MKGAIIDINLLHSIRDMIGVQSEEKGNRLHFCISLTIKLKQRKV